MKYGLEEIATLAGVSKSTVSRVINNHPSVRKATRQRVLEVIAAIAYRPNRAARALVTQQTRVLSVVIPLQIAATFTDPYFPSLIQSITQTANQRDYAIMLWIGSFGEEEERYYNRVLSHGFFDGVLIASSVDDDPLIQRLAAADLSYVVVGPSQPQVRHFVDINNQTAACQAVGHLLQLGYCRVGMIAGPTNLGAARARLAGYRAAFAEAGRPVDEALIVSGDYNETSGYATMNRLIAREVDAVFCASDVLAVGALRAIAEAGLCVPTDIAVVGFDDMPFAATLNPPLTTVHQPLDLIGEQAALMLISLIEGEPLQATQIILTAHLIVRESCGTAKIA